MILTKEQCDYIVENNSAFKCKKEIINSFNVVQYNYLIADYSDFVNPVDGSGLTAEELRGLTFIQQNDSTWKRFLHLDKFYNLKRLGCDRNNLKELPLLPNSLQMLFCSNNNLKKLPLLPNSLKILYCDNNNLKKLPTLPNAPNHQ